MSTDNLLPLDSLISHKTRILRNQTVKISYFSLHKGRAEALQAERSRVLFPMVSSKFFIFPSRPHYGPEVDSASNRNDYQECFLGSKGGLCLGLTLPPLCADCLEIWEPQPPGTLRAYPGL
jgi:hypothetical protein